MSTAVKVGQVWRDKDKRRNTTIEIISVTLPSAGSNDEVIGLVVGTEEERTYKIERLITRWALVADREGVNELIEETLALPPKEEPVKTKFKTREQWLTAAVTELTKLFKAADYEVPAVRVSVGWPGGRGKKTGIVGQCFASVSAADKVAQIFVSPTVSDSLSVMATMCHELVHAVDDCKSGHKKDFIKIAKAIGFLPAWTSSENRSDELTEKLQKIVDKLGPFPHAAIRTEDRPVVQRTYMLKVVSINEPDFFVRMTAGKIEEFGFPRDPWGDEMELEDS